MICSTVLRFDEAEGPSGLDAHSWQHLCIFLPFHDASTDLSALVSRKLLKHLEALQPLLNIHL